MTLASTAKDICRLKGLGQLSQELIEKTDEIEIELNFENPDFVRNIIDSAINSAYQRSNH